MGAISFALMLVLVCTINSGKPFTIRYDNGGTFDYSSHLGNYNYKLDLPDQQREEDGLVELRGAKEESYAVRGKYSFTLGGTLHTVYYTSDQDGYRARVVNEPMTTTSKPIIGQAIQSLVGSDVCKSILGCGRK